MTSTRTKGTPPKTLSFEFFPPQSPEAEAQLWRSVERLAPLSPSFVSVTYGAGGTTRERTKVAIRTIQERAHLSVAGHLTCVGASRAETMEVAHAYRAMGVTRIVALRGDPPKGETKFVPHPEGFTHAAELVEALAADGFDVTVGAYPETHPEAASPEADIDNLKRKLDAGADRAITQFFFEADCFLRFRDRCVAAGIDAPIIPGILPIENFQRMSRFASACGTSVPDWMERGFADAAGDDAAETTLATTIATDLCGRMLEEGVDHLHFYTLNKPDLTFNIARALGFEPVTPNLAAGNGVA
ncbi:methylenetetrahydrofolate reductase [NAD(P)H] [Halovulum dunhuangense]|uniref:Methylenetetrahydrofolate reductase n=1 Tax=Halovulum dunhuangense TaxID=1505036 RepID=A0A849L2X1_9RHOB|nr:methylenetetrahydrofolate reductase [NAD(P)H] [Halovulum dunhuangense]NNU80580.1 methylenetetrahydrofolate reductase [NAD(P)H] [Halovulum dunhuangense]